MTDRILRLLPYVYLCAVSLVAVCVTIYDKWAAKRKPQGRVPEKTLCLWAAVGGSFAMYLTMQAIRHKTKHASFMIGIPAIMVVQIAAIIAIGYFL